jgi:hypothetical protein
MPITKTGDKAALKLPKALSLRNEIRVKRSGKTLDEYKYVITSET